MTFQRSQRAPAVTRFPKWVQSNMAALLEALPDALLVINHAGEIVLANAHAEVLFRASAAGLVGQPVQLLIPERFREHALSQRHVFDDLRFDDPRMRGLGARLDFHALRVDGAEFPVEISLSALATEEGAFVISVVRDITSRRNAEEQFRGLLECAPDAMVIVDHQGEIVQINSQTEKLFGYTRQELLGRPMETLVPDRFLENHEAHRIGFFAAPRVRPMGAGLELHARRKDNSEFPVEISLSSLPTPKGLLVTAAIRDMTQTRQASAEIRALNAELQQRLSDLAAANRDLESFSYSVSHDLRAPLRQIDGFSRIVMEESGGSLSPDSLACLQHVRNGAHHMGDLVDALLDLSRLGRQQVRRQKVDFNLLVAEVVDELQRESDGREVQWRVEPFAAADCDPVLIKQVFVNLLGNARKFSRSRRPAVIESGETRQGGERVFWVRDNGVGFDMKHAERLFGVFQRLHAQEEFEGTGVGLASVQRIVLKHGGRIWTEARPGAGATFFFTLGPM